MSTFKNIQGKNIRSYANNAPNATAGEMWYNRTEQKLKGIVSTEATISGSPMINQRSLYGFGVGTGTAGLVVGGIDDSTYLSVVEEYNGSGWATGGAYPTARYSAGTAGTQTAAIAYCGRISPSPGPGSPAETYNYDGSSWTAGNSFPTGNNSCQGIGAVNTAVVSTQEYNSTAMHHWNGTSWTAANARNTAKGGQAAFGTQTAAVLAGGYPSESNITEVYDGTNWTSGNTMNTGRNQIAGSGTQTDGLAFGGDKPPSEAAQTTIESWDGTSWATSPATLATARSRSGTGRNTASGTWIAGGIGPGGGGEAFNATEEYNKSTNVFTAAAWASGGNYPSSVQGMGAAGTQTATVTAGGAGPTNLACTYDGSSWSTITNYPQSVRDVTGTGVQTAGFMISGYGAPPPTGGREKTNYWNGSAWVAGGDLNNSSTRQLGGSAGILTAALYWGGDGGTPITAFESYNGSAWTALTATPFGGNSSGCGTSTAALATPGPSVNSYEWGGSSWTAGGNMPVANAYANLTGTQTDAIHYGGYASSAYYAGAIGYDGTTWSTRPSMATARGIIGHGTAGTSTSALATAGYAGPGGQNATEEFTGETTSANIVDITTS